MDQTFLVRVFDGVQQLQENGRDILEIGQGVPQVARQRAAFDKGHHQVQQAALVTELDQGQNVRVLQLGDGTSLARKAAAHFTIGGIVAKNHLDGDTPPERGALSPLVNRSHTSHANAPDNVVIPELRTL